MVSSLRSLFLIVAAGVVAYLVGHVSHRGPAELTDWKQRAVGGLVVDSPGDFKDMPMNFGAVQKLIEHGESFKCVFPGFEIGMVGINCKPGTPFNLDGAVAGAAASVGRLEGVKNMTHTATDTTISGKQAKRVSMSGERTLDGRTGRLFADALCIVDATSIYAITVVYDSNNPRGADYAQRVIGSVKLAP